jgi:hypothetical protein
MPCPSLSRAEKLALERKKLDRNRKDRSDMWTEVGQLVRNCRAGSGSNEKTVATLSGGDIRVQIVLVRKMAAAGSIDRAT